MRANLDATCGLLFADAVATRLAPQMGREAAHDRVEHAAGEVRATGASLRQVLANDPALAQPGVEHVLDAAFDLTPSVEAAALWTDRAVAVADDIRERLSSPQG
jgi:3-carboxy-cis,cis-muconate cycloisomerase